MRIKNRGKIFDNVNVTTKSYSGTPKRGNVTDNE